jgi:hypothetical protein
MASVLFVRRPSDSCLLFHRQEYRLLPTAANKAEREAP